jgi:hypothetical protein
MSEPVSLKPAQETSSYKRILTTTEARQGETYHNVRYVLAISLVLALIAFAILYAVYS